ncbi:methionine--tRNA ligase [Candidatus Shapirobacteria bacterium]|nr:methionine--tRNA ligase [Candidatus Shapirobacteria bacterium]
MAKKFYITTTLPYVNADPHIGFAMEIIRADTVARYHRLLGEEVIFNTGTDEHGLKVFRKAAQEKKSPQEYCDKHVTKYQGLKNLLNLSVTHFTRTTDQFHIEAAQEFWRRCQKNGDIYKAKYQIKYCVGCELEKTESELANGRCPIHPDKTIEIIDEENYFFRFSKYQKQLLALYEERPDFVIPKFRLGEIKKFIQAGPKDFSISRLKSKMPWGVPVPDDPEQVMYVWFDALINYISALGWPKDLDNFKGFWPGVQIAGKDNLRQQSAMWQAMLISAGLPTSKQIYIEGFINTGGQKMSKSLGNVIDPFELVEKYGTDAVRYYLLREIPAYDDGDFSIQRFEELYNADLANGLGNTVSRVAKLVENSGLEFNGTRLPKKVLRNAQKNALADFRFDLILNNIWVTDLHPIEIHVDQHQPWLIKDKDKLLLVLQEEVDSLREVALKISPFLPETAEKIRKQFAGPKIKSEKPLFPRV